MLTFTNDGSGVGGCYVVLVAQFDAAFLDPWLFFFFVPPGTQHHTALAWRKRPCPVLLSPVLPEPSPSIPARQGQTDSLRPSSPRSRCCWAASSACPWDHHVAPVHRPHQLTLPLPRCLRLCAQRRVSRGNLPWRPGCRRRRLPSGLPRRRPPELPHPTVAEVTAAPAPPFHAELLFCVYPFN